MGDAYWRVRDEVMDIMTALPPPNRQPTAEITDEDSDQRVPHYIMRDGAVPGIVGGEHNLLPECAQKARRRHYPAAV